MAVSARSCFLCHFSGAPLPWCCSHIRGAGGLWDGWEGAQEHIPVQRHFWHSEGTETGRRTMPRENWHGKSGNKQEGNAQLAHCTQSQNQNMGQSQSKATEWLLCTWISTLNNICTKSMKQSQTNPILQVCLSRNYTSPTKWVCRGATVSLLVVLTSHTSHRNSRETRGPQGSPVSLWTVWASQFLHTYLRDLQSFWAVRIEEKRKWKWKEKKKLIHPFYYTTKRDFCSLTTCLATLPSSRLLTFLH